MNTGDVVIITIKGFPIEVTIIDELYRNLDNRKTALVRLNNKPHLEFEINQEEITGGKDIQRSAGLGT